MKIWERKLITAGLAIAGILFLVAAVRPAFEGASLNATFFVIGIVLVVGAVAAWRRFAAGATNTERASPPNRPK